MTSHMNTLLLFLALSLLAGCEKKATQAEQGDQIYQFLIKERDRLHGDMEAIEQSLEELGAQELEDDQSVLTMKGAAIRQRRASLNREHAMLKQEATFRAMQARRRAMAVREIAARGQSGQASVDTQAEFQQFVKRFEQSIPKIGAQ